MISIKGKVKYSFNNQIVESIHELSAEDYNQLLNRLTIWKKNVSEETIKEYLATNSSHENIEWEWCSLNTKQI